MQPRSVSDQNNPIKEELRLQKLKEYEILNTPAEKRFDNFAQMAADVFDVTNAAIVFFARNGTFVKAAVGKQMHAETNNRIASLFLASDEALIIKNNETNGNLVNTFAVGAIIKTPDEQHIGAIFVHGEAAFEVTNRQQNMLSRLAYLVMEMMEVRLAIRKTLRAQDDRLHVLIHDLKNPMTTISLQSELVSRMPDVDEKAALIATRINQQSKRMVDQLNNILSSARKENGSFKPQKAKVELVAMLGQIKEETHNLLKSKNQTLVINLDTPIEFFVDEEKIKETLYQLVQNSSKFSTEGTLISISYQVSENLVTIAIEDQGVGLTPDDLDRLFIKFSNLSAAPTHHENSNGLGLIVATMFVDMHKGRLWATSEGLGKGSTFHVSLPIK